MSGLFEAAHAEARREALLSNAARHRQRRVALAARPVRGGVGSRAARTLRMLADRLERRAEPAGCAVRPGPQPARTGPGARG